MAVRRPRPHAIDGSVIELCEFYPGIVAHFTRGGETWGSAGYRILRRSSGGPWSTAARLPASSLQRLSSAAPWLHLGLRLGIHHLLELRSGTLLATTSGVLYRRGVDKAAFSPVHAFDGFRKPTRWGIEEDRQGRVYLAEYSLNPDRSRPMRVWRSDDDGQRFREVFRFQAGDVRHIHFLQTDPHDGSLWMGTGDADEEAALFRSEDGAETFDCLGRGDQRWRATCVAFGDRSVLWGTDAGRDAGGFENRILRLERASGRLEELERVQGPVHGVTRTRAGGYLVSTGIEDGENESDRCAHLWFSRDGETWSDIAAFARGSQPRKIQYGVIHFVAAQAESEDVYLTLRGLRGCALGTFRVELRDSGSSPNSSLETAR